MSVKAVFLQNIGQGVYYSVAVRGFIDFFAVNFKFCFEQNVVFRAAFFFLAFGIHFDKFYFVFAINEFFFENRYNFVRRKFAL
jgi:hypothetical protein